MIDKIIDQKIILYFVASVIPLLSVSIFLADLIISILSIFYYFLIKNNFSIFYKNHFFIIFINLFLSIAVLLSENILFSLKSSLPLIRNRFYF